MQKNLVALLVLASAANAAASLKDIKHVIMLMMENRSFQHVSETLFGLHEGGRF